MAPYNFLCPIPIRCNCNNGVTRKVKSSISAQVSDQRGCSYFFHFRSWNFDQYQIMSPGVNNNNNIINTLSSSTKWDPITNTLMWDWHVRSSPDWSTLTREVTTDQPVAAIIPHGCSNLDYRGDNPEVEGSVPAEGPPTLQAGSHRVMFIALWRKWFTLCTDKWTKWVETKRKQSSHKIHCQDFIDFLQLPLPRVHCYKSCGTEERRLVKQVAETSRERRRRSRTGLSDSV